MRIEATFTAIIMILGMSVVGQGQDSVPGTTSDPPKRETGRFGDPGSTARAYQNYKVAIVKDVKKGELILDKTSYGDDYPFKVLEKTKFIHDGEPAKMDELKAGDQVFVNARYNKKTGEVTLEVVAWGVVGKKLKGQRVSR
jgi:hypothetical protein